MAKEKRFEIIEEENTSFSRGAIVLQDKTTGVQYLFFTNGYGGGLTPLLDKDGKPITSR